MRVFRPIGRLIGAAFCVVLLYLAAAAIGGLLPRGVDNEAATEAGDFVEVGLIYGPIHVDFLLPADAQTRRTMAVFGPAGVPVNDPRVAHFLVGWGAHDFYTTSGSFSQITWGATWRAISGDASVLRADVVGQVSSDVDVPYIRLSQAQYTALLAAIANSASGAALPIDGHTPTDGFVEARGRFHIGRTCNTWISDMLHAAGINAGRWTPTPYSVRLSLWRAGLSSQAEFR